MCVANETDEPVYGAFVDYSDQSDGHPIRAALGTVPPGSMKSLPIDARHYDLPPGWEPEQLLPALYFRDTRNCWWHRTRSDASDSTCALLLR